MNELNCINCGAPLNPELILCPYCGTSYYDLSFIKMNAPGIVQIKLPSSFGEKIVYAKGYWQQAEFNSNFGSSDTYSYSNGITTVYSRYFDTVPTIDLSFSVLKYSDNKNHLRHNCLR